MDNFDNKTMQFMTALQDMYRDEGDRESPIFSKIELIEDNLTEDFTAMFYALFRTYRQVTGDEIDTLDFVAICNKLVFQRIREMDKLKS